MQCDWEGALAEGPRNLELWSLSSPGLSFFVLMHTISSFGICQGMSWEHLNQPWGWIGVILLSLSSLASAPSGEEKEGKLHICSSRRRAGGLYTPVAPTLRRTWKQKRLLRRKRAYKEHHNGDMCIHPVKVATTLA